LIDVGWISSWPLMWTKGGARALRSGTVRSFLARKQDTAKVINGRLILSSITMGADDA